MYGLNNPHYCMDNTSGCCHDNRLFFSVLILLSLFSSPSSPLLPSPFLPPLLPFLLSSLPLFSSLRHLLFFSSSLLPSPPSLSPLLSSPPLPSPHFLQCSCYVALDKMGSTGWNLKVGLQSFNSIATCTYNMCTCVYVCVYVCVCMLEQIASTQYICLQVVHIQVCAYTFNCVYMFVCLCLCVHVCVCTC